MLILRKKGLKTLTGKKVSLKLYFKHPCLQVSIWCWDLVLCSSKIWLIRNGSEELWEASPLGSLSFHISNKRNLKNHRGLSQLRDFIQRGFIPEGTGHGSLAKAKLLCWTAEGSTCGLFSLCFPQLAFSTSYLIQQSLCLIILPPGYFSCHGNPSALLFSTDNNLSQTTTISYFDYLKGLLIVTLTESHTHLTILHTAVMGIILKCKTCHSSV